MKPHAGAQRGMALVDALIASAVLGIGLAGTTQLALKTFQSATDNRQHTVAHLLAQEAMDCWQAQGRSCPVQDDILVHGVRYQRKMLSSPRPDGLVIDLQVSVAWASAGADELPQPSGTRAGVGQGHILWHSSASAIPLWLGVSSP